MKNLYYTVLEYVYVLSLLILSVFTIVVFLYSARFFPRTYLEEHENKCGANYQNLSLKRSPNFQKLKAQETPDVSTVND